MQLYSPSQILHFQKFFLGGGMLSDPPVGGRDLSPHCMCVKVLGHADLPFFIHAGLTILGHLTKIFAWEGQGFD